MSKVKTTAQSATRLKEKCISNAYRDIVFVKIRGCTKIDERKMGWLDDPIKGTMRSRHALKGFEANHTQMQINQMEQC